MKKTLSFILSILLTSCTISEEPRDQIPEEKAITNASTLYQNTVATLYSYIGGNTDGQGLQGTCRGIYDLNTFGSDEAMLPTRGGDWFDGGIWQAMYMHSWTAGHEIPKNAWLYLYKVITLCNRSLEMLDKYVDLTTEVQYITWHGEVRALRAMYYWYLIDLFGDVPLVTSSDVAMNQVTREKRAVVFDFIVKELLEVREYTNFANSTKRGDFYGRITFPVCTFLLAKLMLNANIYTGLSQTSYYQKCIEYCDQIEGLGYLLEEKYTSNFSVYNENSLENIFVIPMDRDLYTNQQQNLYRSYHYRHAAAYGFTAENGSCATQRAMEIFGYGTDDVDTRLFYNYYVDHVYDLAGEEVTDRTGNPLIYYPMEVEMDLSGSPFVETAGARMFKYEVDKNALKDGKLMDNDIVLFRFADVLLMRAEAKFRLGQNGQDDYDLVRQRANMPSRPISLDNLLDERLLELCWEGWRRQDLIRFGKYKSLYEGPDKVDESDGHTTIFPIPADVRAMNQNLTQNPGY